MKSVPIRVRGEIHVAGDCLARGYYGRPELTAERFIPNPFDRDRSTRLFKTGDLGRFLPDGRLEYLGRADNQVKLRGIRIELGEIESILNHHPLVQESVVTVWGNSPESEQLVAYVVGVGNTVPGPTELRQYLNSRVPNYMIPYTFVALEALPLLSNGKVNRNALPPVNPDQDAAPNAFIAPRNEIEEKLALLWRDLLGIERIGIDRNFFQLGGHSLLGMQLLARIRRMFDVELPVRRLFEEPTIAGLALEIEKARAQGTPISARTVVARRRNGSDALAIEVDKLSPDQIALLEKLLREKQNTTLDPT
jgi:acyl carrier protein